MTTTSIRSGIARACHVVAARRLVLATAAAVLIGGRTTAFACPVCFGAEETHLIDGTKLGILVLLAITLTVQGGLLGFFLYLRQHMKRHADAELDMEWLALQKGSRTS